MSMNHEVELKGMIGAEELDQLKNLPAIRSRAVGRARSRKLVTVYFDTPDLALRQLGLSLRIRRVGSAYVQCVKQAHKRVGGILVRTEWEGPVPSSKPAISVIENKKLRRRIRRAGVERLQPVFRTSFQRSSRSVEFDDGSTATLDIDVGEILAGDLSEPICEFELELESGAPERIFELASEIGKAVPFRLSALSKASRGYALVTGDAPQPRKRARLNFAKDDTVEQVLTDLVHHCLDNLQVNEAVVLKTDDPEGVHQMRVALRRLRAALKLFKSALPEDQYGWVTTEAKWLTTALSEARGWDVFADELVAPVALLYGEDHDFEALLTAVERARLQSRQRARDAVATKRYTDFLLRLGAWLSGRAWREQPVSERTARLLDPIGDHCVDLLQKRDKAVRKQGRQIADLSDEALHELRLAVKRLRYAVDFFEGLYPKKATKAYRKHLGGLQDGLGYLRDVAEADRLMRELANTEDDQTTPTWAYAGALTVGWHRHAAIEAKQRLVKVMAKFLDAKPFW